MNISQKSNIFAAELECVQFFTYIINTIVNQIK